MSLIARWSYKNTAIVRPFIEEDLRNGGILYGAEYEIPCSWIAKSEAMREAAAPAGRGEEFISRFVYYHEDPRPKFRDLIQRKGSTEWEEIRLVTEYDMAMFNDTYDYEAIT